jgi:hypothetical protein
MTKRSVFLVLCFIAAGSVFADLNEDVLAVFNDFLGRLVAKHDDLGAMAMPGIEVRAAPGEEDIARTIVVLTFKTAGEQQVFCEALKTESIPFGTFPNDEQKVVLFSADMIPFILKDAIGL